MSESKSNNNNNDRNNDDIMNEPETSFIVRTQKGWQMYEYSELNNKLIIKTDIKSCHDSDITFSDDGEYFGVINIDCIEIYNSYTYELIGILKHNKVRNMYFSPLNNYIISFNNRNDNDKHGNCYIWRWNQLNLTDKNELSKSKISNDKPVYQFFLKDYDKLRKPVSFSSNEIICARCTKNAILIHDCNTLHYHHNSIIGKIELNNVNMVSIAPTKRVYNANNTYHPKNLKNNKFDKMPEYYTIATFTLPKKGKAATVMLWSYTYTKSKKIRNPFFKEVTRAFDAVDECTFLWNLRGDTLLAIASSEVDHTGRSYYGNQTLYLLNAKNKLSVKLPTAQKGKLQETKWHPWGREFLMIDDHPTKISGFDFRGRNTKDFKEITNTNTIRFSNDGRFMWCGGFGNLNGEMIFYDWKQQKIIGYNKSNACRTFEWAPNSRIIMTASLYPFMTVDNGFMLYKYNGKLLVKQGFERLYQIIFRPSLYGVYTNREPTPESLLNGPKKPTKTKLSSYVPPHLRKAMMAKQNNKINNNNKPTPPKKPNNNNNNGYNNNNNNNNNTGKKKRNRKKKNKPDKPGLSGDDNRFWARGAKDGNNNSNINNNDPNIADSTKKKRKRKRKKKNNNNNDGSNNNNNNNNNGNNSNIVNNE